MPDGGSLQPADAVYWDGFVLGLTPDPVFSVDEWADARRILSSVASSEPGPWRTDRTPYLRELMQELSPQSRVERVVLMKGAQTGGSEAGFNWLGSIIDVAPGPAMMVQPTVDTAKKVSKQRVEPMIDATPELREKIKDARTRDSGNTILVKEFPGGVLVMTGANSSVGLRSMPVRYLFLDEVDGYPNDVEEEGDPVNLAIQRTANFPNRKIFLCSTPTVAEYSRIEKAYLESDQRRYFVPCPECGFMQFMKWSQIRWTAGKQRQAEYLCESPDCGCLIPNHKKAWMMATKNGAEWRATAEGDGFTAGFHLSALYSPWVSWGEIAHEFILAKKDPSLLKVFFNTKLGETWQDGDGDTVDPANVYARREEYGPTLPAEVVVLVAGVDVQDDRIELELVGYGRDEESWSIDYRVLYGDPSDKALWAQLDEFLLRRWQHPVVGEMRIAATAVDTGGHHTLAAYAFVRPREHRRRVWAIKGMGGKRAIWPRRPSRNNKGKVNLWLIGVDTAKENFYARLRKLEVGAGYCHFPKTSTYDEAHFAGLTAEKCRTKFLKGFKIQEWYKKDGDRNEPLDCRVYAYAALQGLISMGLQLNKIAGKMLAREADAGPSNGVSEPAREAPTPESDKGPRANSPKRPARRVVSSGYMNR